MLCRKLIPTLTLLSVLAAPSSGAAAGSPARPPADEPRTSLAAPLLELGHRVAALWSTLTAPTNPANGPTGGPGSEGDGQGGHDPNGVGDPPTGPVD